MAMLYEEKIAKRFAKIKPDDFDFWEELDSALTTAFYTKEKSDLATVKNYDRIVVSIAYIFVCYGMYELHSTICACLMPKVLLKLVLRADVELALQVMEQGSKNLQKKKNSCCKLFLKGVL